jgi:hypothetical protein
MALTAVFDADFDRFETSLMTATVHLQTFDRATLKSTQGLKRELESLSGQKLAVEAGRMAEAVHRLGGEFGYAGGVAKLTDTELKRITATLDQMAQKAQRMGQALPTSIANLRAEIAKLPQPVEQSVGGFSTLSGVMSRLGPLLPISTVAGLGAALIGMAKGAVSSASEIEDLANKTGLGREAIQRMQNVANQTGTSLDAFTNAAFKLGVNVADGTGKARKAVDALGLSYESLRAMKPEQQFAAVVAALEKVDNQQERNRLGVALFGKQFSEIAASIQEGYTKIADAAKVSSDAQIQALDKAADAWQQFVDDAKKSVQSFLGSAVMRLQEGAQAMDFRSLTKEQREMFNEAVRNGENLVGVMMRIRGLSRDTDIKLSGSIDPNAKKEIEDYIAQLKEAQAEVGRMSTAQRSQLNAALKLGGDAARDYAEAIGLSDEALRLYQASLKGGKKDVDDRAKAESKMWNDIGEAQMKYARDALDRQEKLTTQVERMHRDMANEAGMAWMELDETMRKASSPDWLENMWVPLKDSVAPDSPVVTSMGRNIVEGIGDTFRTQFGPTILDAVTGGGSVLKSIGSLFGKSLGDSIVGSFSESFGKSGLGQVLSSVIPGIGALLGPLLGKIGDMFGVSKEVKQAREELEKYKDTLREMLTVQQRAEAEGSGWAGKGAEEFIAIRDALMALGRPAAEAEALFKRLFNTDDPDEMRRAIEEVNEVFKDIERNAATASGIFDDLVSAVETTGERIPEAFLPVIDQLVQMRLLTEEQANALRDLAGEPSWQQMEAAAKALGIDVAQIGKGFDSKKLQSSAQEMLKNFNILRAGGMDVGTMLVATKEQMSKMVREAIALGTELPEGLREYIEELSRSGQLVDENGNALKDLSRLNFAEPLEKSVSNLIKKFEELINLLLNGVAPALGSLPIPGDIRIPRGAGDGSPVLPGEPPLLPPRPGTGERGEFGGTTSTTNTTTNLGVAVVQVAAGASEEEITQAIIRSLPRQVAGNFMGVGVGLREALDIA